MSNKVIIIVNFIFQLGVFLILFILSLSFSKIIYMNIINNTNNIKQGIVIDSQYDYTDDGESLKGTYINTILLINEKDTVYGGSQNILQLGDSIRLRNVNKERNIIFEVNNQKIASKYDIWDILSPILLIFCLFLLFKVFIQPLLQKILLLLNKL